MIRVSSFELRPSHSIPRLLALIALLTLASPALAQRQMEHLARSLVAIRQPDNHVFLSWRLLATDPDNISFNLYCQTPNNPPVKLNPTPIADSTNFLDTAANPNQPASYFVRPLLNNQEQPPSPPFTLKPNAPPYLSIPLRTPPGYTPNDASVGDLDGDGEYEIVLHQTGRARDNSQRGPTDPPILQAYKLDGSFLWQINLGKNIREGAHYTQFIVYDLDSDGRAEIACKTADGSTDAAGNVIGNPNADHRNPAGYVLDGPEFLTVFDGQTGHALATTDYLPPRGNVADWGDNYGNRVDRFLACVAYLDGQRPSLIMCRGYYTRAVLVAFNFRDNKLAHLWTFDSDDPASPNNKSVRGQGNHNLAVGDVDSDGHDEIVYGAAAIDHDGKLLYSTNLGHGDAMHLADLDPTRPGLEVFSIHERPDHPNAASFYDAKTGQVLWGKQSPDVGRGLAADIDPKHPGSECWAASVTGLFNCKGQPISARKPRSCNFAIWWDGDLLRELLDRNTISKWNWETESETTLLAAAGCSSNNGTKATPALSADLLGDWREEVIWRTTDNQSLRIYTTTIPTTHRLYTLMHDPQYRLAIVTQNIAYNQPPHPRVHLGPGMSPPPRPSK